MSEIIKLSRFILFLYELFIFIFVVVIFFCLFFCLVLLFVKVINMFCLVDEEIVDEDFVLIEWFLKVFIFMEDLSIYKEKNICL